jgi:hypothetical protein
MTIVIQGRRSAILGLILFSLSLILADNAFVQEMSPIPINDQLPLTQSAVRRERLLPQPLVRSLSDEWVPPDIDTAKPAVANGVACSMHEVASKVGTRIGQFFDNLNRLTAIETIQHQTVNRSGTLHYPEIQKIEYVASVKPAAGGYLSLQEYRGGYHGNDSGLSSDHIETTGMFSLAVIFHPSYAKDYRMTCEGLGTLRGQPAWQVRFEELPDNLHGISGLNLEGKNYGLRLRGRAWILADSYQLARLETDLVQAIPEIRLRLQHQVIEYSPGNPSNADAVMWLPSSAEMYMDFRGHRFYRRHSYADYQLFSVRVHQEFGDVRE